MASKTCEVDTIVGPVALPLLSSYTHLGVLATAAGSLEHELRHRIGSTMSAFASIRKTIIGNRRLSHSTRCTLVGSLLLSKLFFGCGAWPLLTTSASKSIDSVVVKLYREALDQQFWRELGLSDAFLMAKNRLMTSRIRIARDRLIYAASVVQDGPEYLWPRLLHLHARQPEGSWLAGLESDLKWLGTILPDITQAAWNTDWESRYIFWRQHPEDRHRLVQKACRLHLDQECSIGQVRWWHNLVLQELKDQGAKFPDLALDAVPNVNFKCHCNRGFKSTTALAVHQRQAHSKHAPEFHMASGTVCPSCLVNYWSTKRLRQHLSYAPRDGSPNWCFHQLQQGAVYFERPEVQHPDKAFQGINRLDACRVQGPVGHSLTGQFALRRQLQEELVQVEEKLSLLGWQRHPDRKVWQAVCNALTSASEEWYIHWLRDYPHGDSGAIQDAWFEVFARWPDREAEMSIIFLHWADECTEDLFALWGNSFAAEAVEQQYVDLYRAFETTPLLRKQRSLMLRIDRLADAPPPPAPHRPVQRGAANATERRNRDAGVPGFFSHQSEWKAELDQLRFEMLPACREQTPQIRELGERPCFLVIHLFSGRRRPHDFHDHLHNLCSGLPFEVRVLSMDTAVSEEFGDLRHEEAPWRLLHKWYSTGRVAATLAGSPCETFSEARYNPLVGPDGIVREGPRVLRTAECLWGLAGRTRRELRQLKQGSNFALQVMWSACMAALYGGLYISEHPAPPRDESRASVWTSPLMRLLRELPSVHFHILSQWLWGAVTPKPTGFLAVRLPTFRASMERWQLPQVSRPEACKMGLGADGDFATSPMKEYPGALCGGLAQAVRDQLLRQHSRHLTLCCQLPPSELQWLCRAAEQSAVIDSAQSMKPDWQDRRSV